MSLCYIYPQHSAGLQIQVQSQTKVDSKKNTDEAKVWERSLDSYFHLRIYYRINHIYTLMIYPALFVHFCKDWCLTSICKSAYWPKNTVKKDVTIEIWTHNYQIIIQHPNQKPFSQNWISSKNGKSSRNTPDGTRTHNLWIRSPTPYPLGHRGWWYRLSASSRKSVILKQHGITILLSFYVDIKKSFVKKNMERFTNLRVILAQGPC